MLGGSGHDRRPRDTTAETISAIIADEAAIGMVNSKTTAVRLIPAPGKQVGTRWSSAACWAPPGTAGPSLLRQGLRGPGRQNSGADAEPEKLNKKNQWLKNYGELSR